MTGGSVLPSALPRQLGCFGQQAPASGVAPGLTPPIPCHQVHDYLRSKLCSLYENDCIFDKFECVWNGSDR